MAILRPFRALRPRGEYAERVFAPPYDTLDRREAKEFAKGNPYSFLRVTRAEIDLPDSVRSDDPRVYETSRENLNAFLAKDIFFREEEAIFYLYAQSARGRTQTGLVACVSVDEYESGLIKRHEYTRARKEEDRVRHFDACDANTEPVFLSFRANETIRGITRAWTRAHAPEYDFVAPDGVRHTLWAMDDRDGVEELARLFRDVPALYIADGHHRSASAREVGRRRREAHPAYSGREEFNFFMAAVFPDDELTILGYHRLVKDLAGRAPHDFLDALRADFTIEDRGTAPCAPAAEHSFGMFLAEKWYLLRAKPHAVPGDSRVAALDVSILQDRILGPLLGIDDPRTDGRVAFVGGIRGLAALEQRVRTDMAAAFSLFPVSVSGLLDVADAGLIMPPKSTWFEPKLGSGLFVHTLR
jgi:uncharacterized protein (DUF1015 family)